MYNSGRFLTNLIQHLVTLIKNEDLAAAEAQELVTDESVQTTWCGDDDVWMCLLVLENLGILLDGSSTIEDCSFDIWHIFAETCVFVLDLICKLTSVTHNENGCFASDWFHLLKSCENENGSLTKTRFGLAENVGTEDGLRNANLLDCRINRAEGRLTCSPS